MKTTELKTIDIVAMQPSPSNKYNSAVAANLQEELSGFLMNGDEMCFFVRVLVVFVNSEIFGIIVKMSDVCS